MPFYQRSINERTSPNYLVTKFLQPAKNLLYLLITVCLLGYYTEAQGITGNSNVNYGANSGRQSLGIGQNSINSVALRPSITEVSAMCTAEGITAMLMFDRPFNGRIYSERYGISHDCIYYNGYDMNMVLFSVPNFKCGTRITRSNLNLIQRIENEIYVQWDKDTQQVDDRRYLFICESGGSTGPINPPINPIFPPIVNTPSPTLRPFVPDFSGTIRPDQTIIIQTGQPTEIVGSGSFGVNSNIYMEIQDGYGPGRPPIERVLELGEPITLVVATRVPPNTPAFDMQVHSCFATDGTGQSRVELVDKQGCTSRESVAQQMQKQRNGNNVLFYVQMKAFKFPSSEDVYFTCSVEACGGCIFPGPCSAGPRVINQPLSRGRRNLDVVNGQGSPSASEGREKMELVQSVRIAELPHHKRLSHLTQGSHHASMVQRDDDQRRSGSTITRDSPGGQTVTANTEGGQRKVGYCLGVGGFASVIALCTTSLLLFMVTLGFYLSAKNRASSPSHKSTHSSTAASAISSNKWDSMLGRTCHY